MKSYLKSLSATSFLALVAGCSTASVEELSQTHPTGNDFNAGLAEEYKVLATFEAEQMLDMIDADHFAKKGLAAAQGLPTEPDEVSSRDIPPQHVAALSDARGRLMDAYQHDAKTRYPLEIAMAQAKYDCWLEQQEENFQPEHIAACRGAFARAMLTIYAKEKAYLSKSGRKDVSRAAETTATSSERDTLIFFDFDKATIKETEIGKIENLAAMIANESGSYDVMAVGHADRAGPESYNQDLSQRRAAAVKEALMQRGISASAIDTQAKGETEPLEPTADGVAKSENRRVQVSIR